MTLKQIKTNLFVAISFGLFPIISNASLIGDSATFYHLWTYNNSQTNVQNVLIGEGVEYVWDGRVPQYSVDVSDRSVEVTFLIRNQFNMIGTFNGVFITGLNDSSGVPLTSIYGFNSTTTNVGNSDIAFGDDWLSIDFGNDPILYQAGDKVTFNLAFGEVPQVSTVPLPPTALLMATALGLLGLTHRNRKTS